MEKIIFDADTIMAERPEEAPVDRYARLQRVTEKIVALHKQNIASFAPGTAPASGIDGDIDAGRQAVWKLDETLLELEARGRDK